MSITVDIPRFFHFELINNDYWTTSIMEDPTYIRFSSYWDELITTGIVPLLALIYFNLRIYLKVGQDQYCQKQQPLVYIISIIELWIVVVVLSNKL